MPCRPSAPDIAKLRPAETPGGSGGSLPLLPPVANSERAFLARLHLGLLEREKNAEQAPVSKVPYPLKTNRHVSSSALSQAVPLDPSGTCYGERFSKRPKGLSQNLGP